MPLRLPATPAQQLQWLMDRAEITELFHTFARAIDEKNQAAYADTFAEDGAVTLPFGVFRGREQIRAMRGPPRHWGTHHIQGNHQISVDGDRATARAYVIACHVFEKAVLADNARAGGWYDAVLSRTADGWRFKDVALTIVWNTGEMIRGTPAGGGMPTTEAATI